MSLEAGSLGPAMPGDPRAAARAIDALRRGWDISIAGTQGVLHLLAIETADAESIAALDPGAAADLLISAARAETLKLTNQREAANERPVRIDRTPWIDADVATAIADPVRDLASPLKGPFRAAPLDVPDAAEAALRLARIAGILPAFYILPESKVPGALIHVADIAAFDDPARIHVATRARLPVAASVEAEIVAFRTPDDPREHVALIVGRRDRSTPVVRLHSECLTGDVLGSLKCDCGPQLHHALHAMAHSQWGVLLYLRQEGRGIGLINKLRAYALQDQGYDTVDANVRLGFEIDARDFRVAARMLDLLGIGAVKLMTNNPQKVARLEEAGIEVTERLPLIVPTNPENEKYLATKRDRTGHQL